MIALKACPLCRGDLFVEWTIDEEELVCLQCGYGAATTVQPARVLAGRSARVA